MKTFLFAAGCSFLLAGPLWAIDPPSTHAGLLTDLSSCSRLDPAGEACWLDGTAVSTLSSVSSAIPSDQRTGLPAQFVAGEVRLPCNSVSGSAPTTYRWVAPNVFDAVRKSACNQGCIATSGSLENFRLAPGPCKGRREAVGTTPRFIPCDPNAPCIDNDSGAKKPTPINRVSR